MTNEEAKELILKYNTGQCTPEEQQLVDQWYQQFAVDEHTGLSETDFEVLRKEMWAAVPTEALPSKTHKLWPRIAAAASIILLAGVGLWLGSSYIPGFQDRTAQYAHDVAPGRNRATITLDDGKMIDLSDGKSGVVMGDGKLSYNDGSPVATASRASRTAMASVVTPRGGTYEVVLPDGTKVQLNASSSIKFPSSFKSLAERRVELNGEAYFEVAKNKKQPFIVKSRNQEVRVLGTHFNVNAYDDEAATKTTLLEGSIQINHKILKPDQQAVQAAGNISIREVNATDAVDWKNGEFICDNEPLESLMRKISRWYDVEVVYSNPELKERTYSGSLSRYDHVIGVLKALEFAGTIKFKLENRRIQIL
ncbi:FecR family protein [Pedobacter africanus]|uniref:FecR family protein n=1 Tax=Pedobacter africanus TaxID=151894 RepID=A0A1W1YUF7_9SPHI|nr:FecR domain-containing protein [Pedobacter africanus]SMC39809.1 FecR family protein [Pedobacter africanus]